MEKKFELAVRELLFNSECRLEAMRVENALALRSGMQPPFRAEDFGALAEKTRGDVERLFVFAGEG